MTEETPEQVELKKRANDYTLYAFAASNIVSFTGIVLPVFNIIQNHKAERKAYQANDDAQLAVGDAALAALSIGAYVCAVKLARKFVETNAVFWRKTQNFICRRDNDSDELLNDLRAKANKPKTPQI